ncbi:protoheme IX farnesyltransferase, mitochondrial [Hetaerina americana]|uniref:protoheme IX farnesyltransferase, mitochondrial n=1 Tax=Hetaerina americana TaxID=62018 RepID=UPI003A7F270E
MTFQVSAPRLSGLVNMAYRRYFLIYRVGVAIRQPYSTRAPHHGLAAAAQQRVAKIQPKEENEGVTVLPPTGNLGPRINEDVSVVRQGKKGTPGRVGLTGERAIPLHDAIDARELGWKEYGDVRLANLPGQYLMLGKFRLTALVVLTSLGGYVMAPYPLEVGTLLALAVGTGLVSSAANAVNQFLEVPFDAQMPRTRNRVLVRGLLTPAHAMGFALGSSLLGSCILWVFANPATACLGILNLFLYTSAYTPLKRITIANTWVGSIVGAIPPLMGWAACSGGSLGSGAWLMAAVLYAWQFPHFNALSWNLRQEYSRAGYRMMAVTHPELCRRTSLRYSVGMIAICLAAPMLEVTTWTFAFDSLPLNMYLTYLSWRFYKDSDSRSSRKLFRFTLLHLPVLMLLMLISKKHHSDASGTLGAEGQAVALSSPSNHLELKSVMPSEKKIVS